MNAILAVTVRELQERKRVFIVAAALAVVPFLAAALPVAKNDRAGAIAMVGSLLSVALGLGTAIVLGVSMISGELAARRMSFYFARPLSETAIWIGKSGAAFITSATAFLIVGLPSLFASAAAWPVFAERDRLDFLMLGLGEIFVALLLFHVAASLVRSRSGLLVADFLLALLTAGVVTILMFRLLSGGGFEVARTLLFSVLGASLLILAVAPIRQLRQGRTDIRRNHRALSETLWIPIAIVVLFSAGYVTWLTRARASSITNLAEAASAPGGPFALVSGHSKYRGDYRTSFLVDTRSGASRRLQGFWQGAAWSRDGTVLAWLDVETLWQRRLKPVLQVTVARADGRLEKTGIEVPKWAPLAVSEDGSRIAVRSEGVLTVYDLPGGRIRSSVKSGAAPAFWFISPEVVRMISPEGAAGGRARIVDFDVRTRQMTTRGTVELGKEHAWRPIVRSEDGARLLVCPGSADPSHAVVVDGVTGTPIFSLPVRPASPILGETMLRDGRLVVIAQDDNETGHLHVYSRDGEPAARVELGRHRAGWVEAEIEGNRLLVITWDSALSSTPRERRAHVINLDTGQVEQTHPGLRGLAIYQHWPPDPLLPRFAAASVFVTADQNHKPLLWNLATGELTPLGSTRK